MTTQNSLNNTINSSYAADDFSVTRADAGNTVKLTVSNSDNSSTSSRSYIKMETGGANAGDPKVVYSITGGGSRSLGIDNSDSDAFVLSRSTTLGTSNSARCDTSGKWTYPENACFSANLNNVNKLNVTGDGNNYIIPFDTEIFDVGGDFSTVTGKFTAPVTGVYIFTLNVFTTGHTTAVFTSAEIGINLSFSKDFTFFHGASASDSASQISCIWKLTAGDQIEAKVHEFGEAGRTADLVGNPVLTFFTGALVA